MLLNAYNVNIYTIFNLMDYLYNLLMISYEPMWDTMQKKQITQYHLITRCGINPKTLDRIKKGQNITLQTLEKICKGLRCKPNDVIAFVQEK